jgi:DNA modification methylase
MAKRLPDACVDLIYIDPPFNSNRNYEVFWGETREKRAFAELAREKIRTYQRGIDRDSIYKKMKQAIKNWDGIKTLGKLLEELTAGFFDPKKKISKLQIARNYEDLAERRVA